MARTRDGDGHGNVHVGDAATFDGTGNIAYADGGRVVLYGVDDLVVVRNDETTLVMPRERAHELKALLAELDETAP